MMWIGLLVCGAAAWLWFQVGNAAGYMAVAVLMANLWAAGLVHNAPPYGVPKIARMMQWMTIGFGVVLLLAGWFTVHHHA